MTPAIIVPSLNGAHCLPNLISALEKQTYADFSLTIVLDGSTDNSKRVIEDLNSDLRIQIIEQENRGRSGARNAGVKNCESELLIFVDDDMRPAIDFVERHVDHHQNHPHSAVTGRVQSDPGAARTDFQRYLAVRSGQWMDLYPRGKSRLVRSNLFFTGANCSISRKLFTELGGFDENLRDTEDFELATRLLEAGIEVFYDDDCLAWHDDLIDIEKYILRQREYRNSWMAAAAVKPQLVTDYQRFKIRPPSGIRGLFFKLLAHPNWLKWSKKPIFKMLPRGLRYRMFDYIVASLGRFNTHVEIP